MKNQALFSSKGKSKKLKCCLLQFLFGTLRVKSYIILKKKIDIAMISVMYSYTSKCITTP